MLDEAFGRGLGGRSYWAMWQSENPEYGDGRIRSYLVDLFDRRMRRIDGLERKISEYVKAYRDQKQIFRWERAADALLASFGPGITDREFFWEPIPARTYKALMSRSRAKFQGQASRDVSPRVIKDCLDSICRAAAIIDFHSRGGEMDLGCSETARLIRAAGGGDDEIQMLYAAVSSFCTYKNSQAQQAVYRRFSRKYGKGEDGDDWMDDHFEEYEDACS